MLPFPSGFFCVWFGNDPFDQSIRQKFPCRRLRHLTEEQGPFHKQRFSMAHTANVVASGCHVYSYSLSYHFSVGTSSVLDRACPASQLVAPTSVLVSSSARS